MKERKEEEKTLLEYTTVSLSLSSSTSTWEKWCLLRLPNKNIKEENMKLAWAMNIKWKLFQCNTLSSRLNKFKRMAKLGEF